MAINLIHNNWQMSTVCEYVNLPMIIWPNTCNLRECTTCKHLIPEFAINWCCWGWNEDQSVSWSVMHHARQMHQLYIYTNQINQTLNSSVCKAILCKACVVPCCSSPTIFSSQMPCMNRVDSSTSIWYFLCYKQACMVSSLTHLHHIDNQLWHLYYAIEKMCPIQHCRHAGSQ
jgi:hypothetical protein